MCGYHKASSCIFVVRMIGTKSRNFFKYSRTNSIDSGTIPLSSKCLHETICTTRVFSYAHDLLLYDEFLLTVTNIFHSELATNDVVELGFTATSWHLFESVLYLIALHPSAFLPRQRLEHAPLLGALSTANKVPKTVFPLVNWFSSTATTVGLLYSSSTITVIQHKKIAFTLIVKRMDTDDVLLAPL